MTDHEAPLPNAPIQRIASHVGRFGRAAQYIGLFVVLFLVIRFAFWIGQRIGRRATNVDY